MSIPRAYLSLTKPDVTFLVIMTTGAGVVLGSIGPVNFAILFHAVLGTTLISAGTSALNHFFERESDALMRRTAMRPLPTGVLTPNAAAQFGFGLVVLGAAYLYLLVNPLACILGVATTASYLGLYTPLKKRTTWATFVGAFPGAVPPLIGWVAVRGNLGIESWMLYAILFFWQFPHFLAIAWMYREDYSRAGILMLPVVDRTGDATYRQILAYAGALLPASLLPSVSGLAGSHYFFGAGVLGLSFLLVAVWSSRSRSNWSAKWLMHASIIYIPALLGLMIWDKVPH
ncbi:MAG: protoheme IX farnesyltransferase [Acidobacteria bacterium]|nr:protoheme IX farnesyltransferase [Acidobacteriota bacterium]